MLYAERDEIIPRHTVTFLKIHININLPINVQVLTEQNSGRFRVELLKRCVLTRIGRPKRPQVESV